MATVMNCPPLHFAVVAVVRQLLAFDMNWLVMLALIGAVLTNWAWGVVEEGHPLRQALEVVVEVLVVSPALEEEVVVEVVAEVEVAVVDL